MSEDYPASSSDDDDGGAFDGLMDDQEEKELMVMCGQRQVRHADTRQCPSVSLMNLTYER
jgi:hypothetical protein